MGKRYRQFIKKLKNESLCTVTPEDIYMQTDFFDNPKPIVYSKKQYKLLLSLSLSIICAFFCLSVMLIINNVKLRNKEPEIVYVEKQLLVKDDSNGMPDDAKKALTDSLDYFYLYPFYYAKHDEDFSFYIYYGYNKTTNDEKIYYFYYAASFDMFVEYKRDININNETISLNKDNYYGLLTVLDSRIVEDFTIEFDVETKYETRTYVLKNCDY